MTPSPATAQVRLDPQRGLLLSLVDVTDIAGGQTRLRRRVLTPTKEVFAKSPSWRQQLRVPPVALKKVCVDERTRKHSMLWLLEEDRA